MESVHPFQLELQTYQLGATESGTDLTPQRARLDDAPPLATHVSTAQQVAHVQILKYLQRKQQGRVSSFCMETLTFAHVVGKDQRPSW